ncbi:hypothetical protein [Paenibacillus sp. NPDC058071]|uniref:hypothetical protein n=1 Tax=Paenibacillus sp. NPDC058071 TaxID=3346326 RepID=UPI0036DCEC8C
MEQIYPLQEDVISQFCGMPVCVILQDGSRHVGVLSRCGGGKLVLNDPAGEISEEEIIAEATKASKTKKGKPAKANPPKKDVQAQSYPYTPYSYNSFSPFGGALAIDLAFIAFLFLLL